MKVNGILSMIEVLETLSGNLNKVKVTVSGKEYLIFANASSLYSLINKEVSFTHTNGVIDEIVEKVYVDQAIIPETISVESLIPQVSTTSTNVTFDLSSIKPGDLFKEEVILLTGMTLNKSKVSTWMDLDCLDKCSKVFSLRLFYKDTYVVDTVRELVGKYVICSIKNDPRYGLQVVDTVYLYDVNVQIPPEVELAYKLLNDVASKDEILLSFCNQFQLLDKLKSMIYGNIGYHLVEMAAEIMLIDTAYKIDNTMDRQTLLRAVYASRVNLLPLNIDYSIGKEFINYHRIITSTLSKDGELLSLITGTSYLNEIYSNVKSVVESIMKGKGFIYDD